MKSFDLDFQFGTNVLPESDGDNIIKYKNGYVYKEIFLPLNYQDTIGKMLIKTKFTEDIAKILQKVTNINDFIYNNYVSEIVVSQIKNKHNGKLYLKRKKMNYAVCAAVSVQEDSIFTNYVAENLDK